MLKELPLPTPATEDIPVFRLDQEPEFHISRQGDVWVVAGEKPEQLVARTMWQYQDAVERVQRQMQSMGLLDALREAGVQPGDIVRIGDMELEWLW
jgi:GTP-binding protein